MPAKLNTKNSWNYGRRTWRGNAGKTFTISLDPPLIYTSNKFRDMHGCAWGHSLFFLEIEVVSAIEREHFCNITTFSIIFFLLRIFATT